MTYDDLLRATLGEGMPAAKALEFLRGSGASPAEAASSLVAVTGVAPDEARRLVQESRAWSGPRSGVQLSRQRSDWYGAIGQHGRSGHGASSVLPHLARQAQAQRGAKPTGH